MSDAPELMAPCSSRRLITSPGTAAVVKVLAAAIEVLLVALAARLHAGLPMATLAVDEVVTPLATEPVLVIDQPSALGFEPRSAMALNRVRDDRGNGTPA